MMMVYPLTICVETFKVESGCSLEQYFTNLSIQIPNDIVPNYQPNFIHVTIIYTWDTKDTL